MTTSVLTHARLRELLRYDPASGLFTRLKTVNSMARAGSIAGSLSGASTRIMIDGRYYQAARLAWFYVHASWPQSFAQHKNRATRDDRLENLRDADVSTIREGLQRARRDNKSSGLLGAHWSEYHGKWKAHIRVKGKLKHLKYCATAEEAHQTYLAAKRDLHRGFLT